MSAWNLWKQRKTLCEFAGPLGQPDPSGVSHFDSNPHPRTPPTPTMGTRPGMATQGPQLNQVFDMLVAALKGQPKDTQQQFIEDLKHELGLTTDPDVVQTKDSNTF
jgi:hypothetical protein